MSEDEFECHGLKATGFKRETSRGTRQISGSIAKLLLGHEEDIRNLSASAAVKTVRVRDNST